MISTTNPAVPPAFINKEMKINKRLIKSISDLDISLSRWINPVPHVVLTVNLSAEKL